MSAGRILVLTAVGSERDAVLTGRTPALGSVAGLPVHRCRTAAGLLDVACGGVGAVAAGLTGAALLAAADYDLVISTGIGGGFAPVELGTVVVATAAVHADLGAQTADGGFSSLAELGWGPVRFAADREVSTALAARTGAVLGEVLTVSMVTGTRARAEALQAAHPDCRAEGMEGAGVAQAAARAGVRFAELRAISNPVGPRERDRWQIPAALAALGRAFSQLLAEPLVTEPLTAEPRIDRLEPELPPAPKGLS